MELNAIDSGAVLLENGRLPEHPSFEPGIRRAPRREARLSAQDKALAVKNALRYIPPQFHAQMAEEFARELQSTAASTAIASGPGAGSGADPSTNMKETASRAGPFR